MARRLEVGGRERLSNAQNDILTEVTWDSRGKTACDVDISCLLLDSQGRVLEIVDFNNSVSNDHAVCHGGDALSVDAAGKSEQVYIDTRRLHYRVHAVAVAAAIFSRTFEDVKLSRLEVSVKHLSFVESALTDSLKTPWFARTLVAVAPLFWTVLREKRRSRDVNAHTIAKQANFVVLFSLSRVATKHSTAPLNVWDVEGVMSQALARTRAEVTRETQQSLNALFPWLKKDRRRLFESVPEVCAALSSRSLPTLKPQFKTKEGLDVESFVEILFKQLASQHPVLIEQHAEAAMLIALLHELFNQIDINGDERVDWDEFTNHTISAGMRAATEARIGGSHEALSSPDEFIITYQPLPQQHDDGESAKPIVVMHYVEELGRILVVEEDSPLFKAYDRLGRLQHSHNFLALDESAARRRQQQVEAKAIGGDALFVTIDANDDDRRPKVSAATTTTTTKRKKQSHREGAVPPMATAATTTTPKVIHDLIYIAERDLLAAALSDHAIHLLAEQLSSSGKHRAYKNAGVIVTHSLHRKLVWSSTAERLFSLDSYSKLYSWRPEPGPGQKSASEPFSPHADIVMDCIFIKDKGLLATCGLDKKIQLWGIENLRHRGTLVGHRLGVRCLAYAQCAIVSGGFDNDVMVWDVTSRDCIARLEGHATAICAIAIAAPSIDAAMVVTLDDGGQCRVWKVATPSASCVEILKLPCNDPPTRTLVLPFNSQHAVDDFSDIYFGGSGRSRMYHVVPVKTLREFAPPSAVVFNSLNLHFVAAVANNIHLWDSRTGHHVQRFTLRQQQQRKCDVSTLCLDHPRQRRLFVGTELGEILTVNYVTGAIMAASSGHCPEEVTGLAFCDLAKCVVSCGADRRLLVWKDVKGELNLLRTVTNAHASSIRSFCYSPPLSIIASADATSTLAVWDFQTLQQHAMLQCDAPITACKIIDPYPILLAADTAGRILVWHLRGNCGGDEKEDDDGGFVVAISPLCSLSLPEKLLLDATGATVSASSRTAITGIAVIFGHRRPTRSSSACCSLDEDDDRGASDGQKLRTKAVEVASPHHIPSVMLFAATDSGHLVSWRLGAILASQFRNVQPPALDELPYRQLSFKPYRKIVRNMSRCDLKTEEAREFKGPDIVAERQRLAHEESVLHVAVVDDPPCVYTTAADGFQRIWRIDLAPYGEFPLPNHVAKHKRTIPPSDWTYYHGTPLEVGPEYELSARKMIDALAPPKKRGMERFRRAVRRLIGIHAFGIEVQANPADVEAEWKKRQQKRSPVDKANVEARASRRESLLGRSRKTAVHADPYATLRKQRRLDERQKRKKLLDQIATTKRADDDDDDDGTPTASRNSTSHKDVDELVREIANKHALPPAFSRRSINQGLSLGFYDVEAVERLRDIAKYSERRQAYSRVRTSHSVPMLDTLDKQLAADATNADDDSQDDDDDAPRAPTKKKRPIVELARYGDQVRPLIDAPLSSSRDKNRRNNNNAPLLRSNKDTADYQRHVDRMREAMASPENDGSSAPRSARAKVGSHIRAAPRRTSYMEATFEELARPHYTSHDIVEFRNSFNYVDVDLSGSINMEEWFMFMSRMNQRLSQLESQLLFIHIDNDGDGSINMRELIAIVFQRCTQDQQRKIFLKLVEQNKAEAQVRRQRALDITRQIRERDMFRDRATLDSVETFANGDAAAAAAAY